MRRSSVLLIVFALLIAACSGTEDTTTTTAAAATTTTEVEAAGPATSPAEIVFDAQASDGSSIVVASVTLPAAGFIAVHSNADGGPGPVIGHSDLLAAGTATDVAITLDTPLTVTDLLFPMVHIDIDEDGVYTFFPPDNVVDIPANTASGDIAVVGAEVSIGG
jgi:S-layer glycoprotein